MSLLARALQSRLVALVLVGVILVILLSALGASAQDGRFEHLPDQTLFSTQVQDLAGYFRDARDLTVGPDGSLYVLDVEQHRVQRFSAEGELLELWGRRGGGDGELIDPLALCILPAAGDSREPVVLVLEKSGRIRSFGTDGAYVSMSLRGAPPFGEPSGTRRGISAGQDGGYFVLESDQVLAFDAAGDLRWRAAPAASPADLTAVAPLADGRLALASGNNQRVYLLGADGQLEAEWSSAGQPSGNPARVIDLVQAPDGTLLASHAQGGDVQRFDLDGTWIETIVVEGLSGQRGLGLLEDGRMALLHVDQGILVIDRDGTKLASWGEPGTQAPGQITQLRAAPDGTLLLVDPDFHRILRLDGDGQWLGTIEGGEMPIDQPRHLDFTPEGGFLVADHGAGRVFRFDDQGAPEGLLVDDDGLPLEFGTLRGIAVDDAGRVALSDRQGVSSRVQVFGRDGGLLASWTELGAPDRRLSGSQGLAFGARGGLFVLDHSEQVPFAARAAAYRFGLLGELQARFAAHGDGADRLSYPTDIRALRDGSLLVADTDNGRLQRYDAWGGHLQSVNLSGSRHPVSADLAQDGRLHVADDRGRIDVLGAERTGAWRIEHYDNPWLAGWPTAIHDLPKRDWSDRMLLNLRADDPLLPPVGGSARISRHLLLDGSTWELQLRAAPGLGLRWRVDDRIWQDGLSSGGITSTLSRDFDDDTRFELELRRHGEDASLQIEILGNTVGIYTPSPTPVPLPTTAPTASPRASATALPRLPAPVHLPLVTRRQVDPADSIPAEKPFLANPHIDVLDYEVDLRIPDLTGNIEARAIVTLTARSPLEQIDLDFEPDGVRLHAVHEDRERLPTSWIGGRAGQATASGRRLRVLLVEPIPAGQTLALHFDYSILSRSAFRQEDWHYGNRLLSGVGWPYGTRRWLPSNDHPSDPARARITLRVPPDAIAAANGALLEGSYETGSGLDPEGLRVFRWYLDSPTPSYNLHLIAGDFEIDQNEICFDLAELRDELLLTCSDDAAMRVPRLLYHPAGLRPSAGYHESMREVERATAFFSNILGPYPYAKLGFVIEPHPFAMEYPSLVALPWSSSGLHELVHHWWGDPLWIEDWGDFWISEGFTTYLTAFYREVASGGPPPTFDLPNGRLAWQPGIDPNSIFDRVPYDKGASAVADLRLRLSEAAGLEQDGEPARDLFVAVLRALYQRYQFDHLGTDGLLDFLRSEMAPIADSAGHPLESSVVEALVEDWSWQWLTWEILGARLDWDGGSERYHMAPAAIGPRLTDLGPVTGGLAWYGLACNEADGEPSEPFQPVDGRIALIERGTCSFDEKLGNAQARGAVAAIIFTDNRPVVVIGGENEGLEIPSGMIERSPGVAASERLEAGVSVTATLEVEIFDHLDRRLAPRVP